MKITKRNGSGHATEGVLDIQDVNTIMWALYKSEFEEGHELRDSLCGALEMTVKFDGRGKNGL